MEWQNEQIRFSSSSGVYRVGFGNRDKVGVLMKMDLLISVVFLAGCATGFLINDFLLITKLKKGWLAIGNKFYTVQRVYFTKMDDDDE